MRGRCSGKILSPTGKRDAVTMLQETMGLSQLFACKIVGQPRSTQCKKVARNAPDDPDADLRKWLRDWAKANQRKGFRRAWAGLRAAGWVISKKKVQRLWREEGLRVKVRKIRKRAGVGATPITAANAPKVLWAIDFLFDSTTDGSKFFGRVDGRRTHPTVRTQHRRESDPSRGSRRRLGEGHSHSGTARSQYCGATMDPSSSPRRCGRSVRTDWEPDMFPLVSHGRRGTSDPSTTVFATSA